MQVGNLSNNGSYHCEDDELIEKSNMSHTGVNSYISDNNEHKKKLMKLCDRYCDDTMKELLQNYLTVFSFEEGYLEVSLDKGCPDYLLKNLIIKLKNWTGNNWEIQSSQGFSFDNFREDDNIQAIRTFFPSSTIVCIRTK
ncbi:MAG: hypothetical protein C4617_01145 [Candidatus Liberibacter europaeus]|uniref:DNA polymerase III subunit gamma/ tau C-terminal domain-containing protein n=1 Tax=Candidatus Liberibacter europaeus TaxID=744859 RepID=A0A2T4VZ32_9HYPH|nr:hypothetical protein [Candidatus Liberibacter europaeus]PTL87037.1 MAG: hypothetical protein C4617_01145 [Candidatus Liberibacter europaeus]